MKGSYFYKKTLFYFVIIFSFFIVLSLIVVNNKLINFFSLINEKSQKHLNMAVQLTAEEIESDIYDYIEKMKSENRADLEVLGRNDRLIKMISKNNEELSNLLKFQISNNLERDLRLLPLNEKKFSKKIDTFDKGLRIASEKEVTIDGKKYILELRDDLNENFVNDIRKGLILNGNIIFLKEMEKRGIKAKFSEKKLDRIAESSGIPYDYYKVYLPIYNENEELIAAAFYELDMEIYEELNLNLKNEGFNLHQNMQTYILIFSLMFFVAAFFLIVVVLRKIYDPLEEVFEIIDDLSKGKFGRIIYIENRERLKPLVKKINRLSENLDFMNKMKNEFLLKKSYEFKEILDNLVGIGQEIVKRKNLDYYLKDELKMINENSNKLLAITKGLTDYYKLEDETVNLDENVNLKKVIEESTSVLNNELIEKNLYVNNTVSDRLYFKGDSLKLFILMTNLLENAIKNSENSEIKVSAVVLGEIVKVNISDKGKGIKEEKLYALQSYFRNEHEPEEIGLGFVLAKKIIKLHRGTIELWSKENKGTIVSFTLNNILGTSDRSREKLDELKREVEVDTIYGEKKILIFCNNYYNCKVLVSFLKRREFSLSIVENKEEMEEFLLKQKADILLVDIFKDYMSDYRLIKDIREKYSSKDLPIIFINNRKRVEEEFDIFDLGINDIVEKPISKDKLIMKIEHQLEIKYGQEIEQSLRKERNLVESISEIQGELNITLNTKKIFSILLKKIKELFEFDSALILLKKSGKYGIIFQEGYFEKEEKNDRLFKSRYLDPLSNSGRIIRLNQFKCKKYFGEKIKSGLVIPLKYVDNNNCAIILKSRKEGFFKNLPTDVVDKISSTLSNSIKNSELFNELEEKNSYLNSLIQTLQSIDKLTSLVYKEKDKETAIYYILLILVNKIKLGYREAYYFQYDKETKVLTCTSYYFDLKNYTEEKENRVSAKELWSKRVKIKEEKNNILTNAFRTEESAYTKELTTEDGELFGKMLKVTVIPVKYNDEKFGLIVLESERKKKAVDEIEKEALRIISANLGIYLHNKKLEEERAKISSNETLNSFAKAIIHELRTPIVGVKGYANIVKDRYSRDEKLKLYMDNIVKNSDRVLDLSTQIVDYAEEESQNYYYAEENIGSAIDEVLLEFKEIIDMEEVIVEKPKEDYSLVFDRLRFKRAFRHIIKNSLENLDFDKEENIVRIDVEKNSKGICDIIVYDNGVGIEEELLKNIFDPLVSTKIQGTGLGLSIAKSIIEKHGWKIKVESVKYNYTKVVIETN